MLPSSARRAAKPERTVELWKALAPSHSSTVTAATEMVIYDNDGPTKAKTKTKNSLDSKTKKSDNGECYVTN